MSVDSIISEGEEDTRNNFDRTWMERYGELVEFYHRTGDCNVPTDYLPNRKLGNWVRTQRAQLKLFKEGKYCTMTEERVDLLDRIDFKWEVKRNWMTRYRELEEHFNYYGNTRVPANSPQTLTLSRWVDRQRTAYRRFVAGKASTLTKERVKLLDQLDFQWKVRDDWFQRYDELVAYFETRGDSLVPPNYSDNPTLDKWTDTQRQQYRLFVRNKPSSLTKEKVELLNKVNFQWKRLEDWIDRFRDLEEYVAKNGDTLVPQLYELNPGLGIWVRNQRTQYKLFKEGKQSKLSLDRIKMLKSLDFEWNAKEAKWMASFVELGKHMRENGLGALPSYQENRRLRNWADEQRKQYRKKGPLADLTLGKQPGCRLTQKRIDLLNLLAFPWTPDDAKNLRDER